MEENKEQIKEEKEVMDKDTAKNLFILSTGLILIIVAILVFLATSWESIPNLLKILVLVAFEFLFLGTSNFTKNKFKLDNVSKTFFYIGMVYIPICFIAISFLELMGNYLSIYGEGKFIFLAAASVFITLIYFYNATTRDDDYMFAGCLISQFFTIGFITSHFNCNMLLVFSMILLYNLLIIKITKNDVYKGISNVLPFILSLGMLIQINDNSWYLAIGWLMLSINFLVLELKKGKIYTEILYNISLYLFAFCLIFKKGIGNNLLCQGIMTIFILGMYGLHLILCSKINNNNLSITSRISSLIAIALLYIYSLPLNNGLPLYIIAIETEILIICNYLQTKNDIYKYLAYVFSNVVFINIYTSIFKNMNFIKLIPMITTSAIIIFEIFNKKEKNNNLTVFLAIAEIISLICVSMYNEKWSVFLCIAFSILIMAYNKKKNNNIYYNLIPLLGLIPCITNNNLDKDFCTIMILILTLIISGMSIIATKRYIYLIVSSIYLINLGLIINNGYFILISCILWCIIQAINEKNETIKIILKSILVVLITTLYYLLMEDLFLLNITVIKLAGISLCGMYFIRKVIKKYTKDADAFEYFFWIGVYLFGLMDYANFQNGIMLCIFILIVILISFYKKYGATFLVSTIAITLNLLNLTMEFWRLIPWWIYLSLIGGLLVMFAIINEINKSKQNKITIKSLVKKYKETFNMIDKE